MRLQIQEVTGPIIDSSIERHEVFSKIGTPKTKCDVVKMLGDQSGKVHTVFRENGGEEFIKTIAAGIQIDTIRQVFIGINIDIIIIFEFQVYLIAKSVRGAFIRTIRNLMSRSLYFHWC